MVDKEACFKTFQYGPKLCMFQDEKCDKDKILEKRGVCFKDFQRPSKDHAPEEQNAGSSNTLKSKK